jgi:cation transport ATPase
MEKTIFEITKMDCPSEENLIRLKLDSISGIKNLNFDIPNRKLTVFHTGQIDQIEKSILDLNLGGQKLTTEQTDRTEFTENANQKKLLRTVLAINFAFFIIEMITGVISNSMGLVYDIGIADNLSLGIQLSYTSGTLFKYEWDDGHTTETVELETGSYEGLNRIDLSVGLRFGL